LVKVHLFVLFALRMPFSGLKKMLFLVFSTFLKVVFDAFGVLNVLRVACQVYGRSVCV